MITVKLTFHCGGHPDCNASQDVNVDLADLYAVSDEDDRVCKGIDTDELPEGWTWQRLSYDGEAYSFCPSCTERWDASKKEFK